MASQTKSEWLLTINASIASYLDASLLVSTGIVLAPWKIYFGLNAWWIGLISTMVTISVAMGSLVGGYLSDRFGRIKVFNLDILFVAFGTAIVSMATDVTFLLIGLFIAGMASGADLPTSLAVISERTSSERYGKVIASTELFWLAGIVLSQGIGFLTSSLGYGSSRIMFGWLALVALITWGIRVFSPRFREMEKNMIVQTAEQSKEEKTETSLKEILKQPKYLFSILGLTFFYLFWNLPANTWGSFVNYFLVTIDHQSQEFSTLIAFVANILGAIILYGVYMKLADTKYRYAMMRVGLLLCVVSFIVAAAFGGTWMIFTISYIVYCMANMLHGEPLYKIWSQSLYPTDVRATVTGITYAIVRAITAVFSFITPVIMGYSPQLLIWILVGSLVLCWISAECVLMSIKHYELDNN
ncbi:MFS transporter [Levilactobacillus angrenensis]|uniref:MFS transporter n=1 Tax=Levilactobacillus angrenensis TaxID=2486020 RepID=A0ABW1UAD1_9LACO|nr:MFS transporter [Levilactobacillus angrenensis]